MKIHVLTAQTKFKTKLKTICYNDCQCTEQSQLSVVYTRHMQCTTYLASSVADFNWMSSLLYHMLYYHSFQYLHLCEHTILCINYIIYFRLSACTCVYLT